MVKKEGQQFFPSSGLFSPVSELPSPVSDLFLVKRRQNVSLFSTTKSQRTVSEFRKEYLNAHSKRQVSTPTEVTEQPDDYAEQTEGIQLIPGPIQEKKKLTVEVDRFPNFFLTLKDGSQHLFYGIQDLGEGSFSKIYLAQTVELPDPVALKVFTRIVESTSYTNSTKERQEISTSREIQLLSKLDHENIVRYIGCSVTDSCSILALNYCKGGDLYQFLVEHRNELQMIVVQKLTTDIVMAIRYLHHNNIVHRDIKLENVLVNCTYEELKKMYEDETLGTKPLLQVTDFGLAREISPENPMLTTRCGSEDYVSPELLMGMPYDGRQSDCWSLGVLFYAIFEGRLPFDPPPSYGDHNRVVSSASYKRRAKASHRIALMDWCWFLFESVGDEWENAKVVVQNCLCRRDSRWDIDQIYDSKWCQPFRTFSV